MRGDNHEQSFYLLPGLHIFERQRGVDMLIEPTPCVLDVFPHHLLPF